MKLIYANPNKLPSPDPPALQAIHTAAALAKHADVHLIAPPGVSPVRGPRGLILRYLLGECFCGSSVFVVARKPT